MMHKLLRNNADRLSVATTSGDTFSGDDSIELAWMIFRRFGYDVPAAAAAWRRMLQNSCPDFDFALLIDAYRAAQS